MARKRKNARTRSPQQRGATVPPQEPRPAARDSTAISSISGIDPPHKHRKFLIASALALVLWLAFLVAMAMRS